MSASVLSLRGATLTPQPLKSEEGILLFNGEIYASLDPARFPYDPVLNDGLQLLGHLDRLVKEDGSLEQLLFESLEGEFALVYYSRSRETFFIAKDAVGRRSLLISGKEGEGLLIGSVIPRSDAEVFEIPAGCLISISPKEGVAFTPD